MKKLVLALAFAVVATPALALGPEAYSVDINNALRGSWQATAPQDECQGANCPQQQAQQGQQQECYGPNCPPQDQQAQQQNERQPQPRAQKASGKPRGKSPAQQNQEAN